MIFTVFCVFLTNCAVSTRTQYEDNDGYLSESFFKSIKKNRTLKDVVVNKLGEPIERLRTENGDEIYSYAFTKSQYKHRSLFFIARYNTVRRDERYFHIIFNDGRVKKYWWNNLAEVSPSGEVVSRWPNDAGTDYSLRVIKNAEPDKTNFVLTRTIRPTALRTVEEPAVLSTTNMPLGDDSGEWESKEMVKEEASSLTTSSMSPNNKTKKSLEAASPSLNTNYSNATQSSTSVPIVDAVPSEGLFPNGKPSSLSP